VAESSATLHAAVQPASLGMFRNGNFVALHPGNGRLTLSDDHLKGDVPIEVAASPARTKITPARPNVDPNGTIVLAASAFDAGGYALTLPSQLRWMASAGSIDRSGQFHAGAHNANVSVRIGNTLASVRVTVGSHDVAVPFAGRANFVTLPHGGPGSLAKGAGCASCVRLSFSFAGGERAAYAMADVPLPPGTIGLTFDLQDDGSAARVRVAVRNEINEETLVDATQLGRPGWRTIAIRFAPDIQGTRLTAIYVLPPRGIQLSEGSIVLRNVRAIVAGR
jgi:hypothetical protein